MTIRIRTKHSAVQDREPQAADLVAGELAVNIHEDSAAIYLLDSAGAVRKIAAAASANAPANPQSGDTWVDPSTSPPQIQIWDPAAGGGAGGWVAIAGGDVTNPDTAGIWERTGTNIAPATAGDTVTVGTPTADGHAATKKYVDDAVAVENLWDRTGTVLSPSTAGDQVDTGTGKLTVGGGYNILKGFNRRPPVHRGPLFTKTAAATISIVANSALNGFFYDTATAVSMPSHSNNTDYAIWQHPTTGALVADASFTSAPAGATGGSIVGGYHYIPSGRPTAVNNGSPTGAAEILEFSLWDLTWRPSCPDPRGMACIEGGFWMDLYLCGSTSYAGSTFSVVPSSRIGLTIADGSSPPLVPAQYGGDGSTAYPNGKWYVFTEVARSFGKRLPTYDEFSAAAFGAPEATSRGTDPGTVQWERVSKFGLAQATGVLWQWGQETCSAGAPSAWTSGTETDGRGQVYGPETRAVVLGGNWGNPSRAGSRCAYWSDTPWDSNNHIGARFAAGHLVLG